MKREIMKYALILGVILCQLPFSLSYYVVIQNKPKDDNCCATFYHPMLEFLRLQFCIVVQHRCALYCVMVHFG